MKLSVLHYLDVKVEHEHEHERTVYFRNRLLASPAKITTKVDATSSMRASSK
jgi:hypothetical protein